MYRRVGSRLGPRLEAGHLEDPHRPVPDEGLRPLHRPPVQRDRLRPAIEAEKPGGHPAGGLRAPDRLKLA